MSIITFYSYKGGVGRSLALANVAVLMAKAGKKILVIDWDLEAPGLEEYFDNFRLNADGRGLLPMLVNQADLEGHLWTLTDTEDRFSIDFLPSGRDESDYYPMLERFNQDDFFASGGGDYLEQMRGVWKERYDHVLIDSRTGLSDASGVCTIFLPDIIVGLFTATKQSYRGVRDVMELAQHSRRDLAYARPKFSFVPVPCRIDDQGTEDVGWWMEEFTDAMGPLTDSWRPKELPARAVLEGLRVDHVGELSQGTEIIQEAGSAAAAKALKTYEKLAELLSGGLQDVSGFEEQKSKGTNLFQRAKTLAKAALDGTKSGAFGVVERPEADGAPLVSQEFKHDIYFSVSAGSLESEWAESMFQPPFEKSLQEQLGRRPRIYSPYRQISAGSDSRAETDKALYDARLLFVFMTARTERSAWTLHDINEYSGKRGPRPIFPILLGGEVSDMPSRLKGMGYIDFRKHFVTVRPNQYLSSSAGQELLRRISVISESVATLLPRSDT